MPLRMYGQYIIQDDTPAESPVMEGTLWYDTLNDELNVCTSVAPYVFTQIGAGSGTVTSVGITVPSLLSVSGSPITTAGTFAVTWNAPANRVPYFSALNTLATSANLTYDGTSFRVDGDLEVTSQLFFGTTQESYLQEFVPVVGSSSLNLVPTGALGSVCIGDPASAIFSNATTAAGSGLIISGDTSPLYAGIVLAATAGSGAYVTFAQSNGTLASPTATTNGLGLGSFEFVGYGATGYKVGARVDGNAVGNFSDTSSPGELAFATTPSGSVIPAYRLTIQSDGSSLFAGHVLFTDNTYDIGASGATRPRTAYIAMSAIIGGTRNLVTTSTDGEVVQNTTAATVGVPVQISPRHRLSGTGWDTDDSVSRTVSFFTEVLPGSAATVVGTWQLGFINPVSAAITYPFSVTGTGTANILTQLNGGTLQAGAGSYLQWNNRSRTISPANGQINWFNSALSAGVGFDHATDAVLKVRTTAQTAYATVDALAYQVSGVTTLDANGLTLPDADDIILGTGTGTKIGTATSQKLGFYNATPIVQGASVADATGGAIIDAEARTAINALISRIEATGLIATV